MANFDEDYVLALQLQEQMNAENTFDSVPKNDIKSPSLVDPYWEMTDPNPDVRALFLQFNDRFFWGKLAGIEVRWSPRMTLCAGLCCYEGRGGLCSVRLSVPLLKLRPRKDLVETLLHEMIHAYLFVTDNNKDHDGHGPEFHKHMYRINKEAGTNITVYHDFHDEVESYRQHWWRCDGPCRDRKPYYGYVKRTMNRAPSKNDTWWAEHQRTCGGTYTKVKEPEDYGKKKGKDKESKDNKKEVKPSVKSMDIRVFGGKGVTLSGSKSNSSGNTPSSAVSIPSKKPPSATVTSDIEVDKSDNSPSMLSSLSKSASNSKGKELLNSNTFINNRESTEDQNNLPALPELPGSNKINSTNARGVIQSKFADSDFSDSDDDLLLSASEEHISGKFTDTGSSKISGEKGTREKVNNILFDNDMQAPKAVTSDDSNDVRAMLRKVWGEKNIGTGNKKKVVPKKFTGTISRIQGKSDPLNVTGSIKNKGSFRSPAFVNGKKVHSGSEINRPKPSVIGVDKKRPSTIDHHDDMPESKRLKKEISSCSEQIETETELNRHSTKPGLFDDKVSNQFPDAFSGLKIKNDDKFPDKQECDRRGDKSQVFNKVRTSEEFPSPEQDIKAKSMCPIKSPIERLFDKVKERQTANVNIETSDCDIDMVRETNVVNSEAVSIFREIKDISSCPVCNKGVPTATINEHLDLCLTLKVL